MPVEIAKSLICAGLPRVSATPAESGRLYNLLHQGAHSSQGAYESVRSYADLAIKCPFQVHLIRLREIYFYANFIVPSGFQTQIFPRSLHVYLY